MEDSAKERSEDLRKQRHKQLSKEKPLDEGTGVRHQNRQLWERVWNREPGQITAGSTDGSLRASKRDLVKKGDLLKNKRPWQLEKHVWTPLNISARKRHVPPKVIRVKTVEVLTDEKGKRTSRTVIEEGRSLKDMPFRKKALPPSMQSVLSI